MNELHAKFAERGLLIIGVSDEAESAIQSVFIDKIGAKYPIVKVDAKDVAGYGIKFYPSLYCLDADGNVVSVPDDREPSEARIEELLKNVTLAPKLPAEARYEPLRALWNKKDYGKLRDHLAQMLAQPNLDAAMREVYEGQQKVLDQKVAAQQQRVAKLGEGPDFFTASAQLAKIEKEWKGFPVAAEARAQLTRFAGDAPIRQEIAAGKALQKLLDSYDPSKQAQARKLLEELARFAKKHPDTYAGQQAAKMVAQ
ncbi:MAG: hypothetical protein K8J09_11445, partial [Planctomycetes bacterium]|nr:hypothetical protein [Planctomycetota bacterium]